MQFIKGSSTPLLVIWFIQSSAIDFHDWLPVTSTSQSTFEGLFNEFGKWHYQIHKQTRKDATTSSASFSTTIRHSLRPTSLQLEFTHVKESAPSLEKFESWKICLEEKHSPERYVKDSHSEPLPKYVCLNMTLSKTDASEDIGDDNLIYNLESKDAHVNLINRTTTFLQQEDGGRGKKQKLLKAPFGLTLKRESVSTRNGDKISDTSIWSTVGPLHQESTVKFTSTELTRNPDHEAGTAKGSRATEDSLNKGARSTAKADHNAKSSSSCTRTTDMILGNRWEVHHEDMDPDLIFLNTGKCTNTFNARHSKDEIGAMTRLQEINQTLSSDFFLIHSNMTIDVTPDGHQIIWIYQRLNLPFCPAIGWSLKQIFNFSSSFSGWEYVVSQWQWGNMVVHGKWGQSFFQLYQKSFEFSFDQGIPLPSTRIILDFKDYNSFEVRFVCPALASSVIVSLRVDQPRFTLHVEEQDEFAGEGGKSTLMLIEGIADDSYITLRPYANVERLQMISRALVHVGSKIISHPRFCGPITKKLTIEDFLLHLLGYKDRQKYWENMKDQLTQYSQILDALVDMKEVQALRELLLQHLFTEGSFNVWASCKQVWTLVESVNLVEIISEKEGMRVNIKKLQQWIQTVTALVNA